ncbi:MAG TPA: dihydroorotate dehydrogenase, partial [Pseudomonadales bacterium]|nr:dihydroorotate dehydrogenase [Pseudomonadales bacterium]
MPDLRTSYLGLELANPLVPSSSPLTGDFDSVRYLEDAGAAAIVLPSLFEEALQREETLMTRFLDHQDIGYAEATSFLPDAPGYMSTLDQYIERIECYRKSLSIPVIGSLNGVTPQGWIRHALDLQQAGCDALELNLYGIAARREESAADVENRYLALVRKLLETITIPVAVKLSAQFSSPAHFIGELEEAGVHGVCVFNRFYQPDIDLATRHIVPSIHLSHSHESLVRIRWIAMLRSQIGLGIAATGGFHTA